MTDMEAVRARYPDCVVRGHGKSCWVQVFRYGHPRHYKEPAIAISDTFECSNPKDDQLWAEVEALAWASARARIEKEEPKCTI